MPTTLSQNSGNMSSLCSNPSSSSSSKEELSVPLPTIPSTLMINSSTVPRAPARAGNDSSRINHVLEPLLQAARENESWNNAAAKLFPGQFLEHLNTILERQQTLNEHLKQRIMAVEEQSQNGREMRTTQHLPKALMVRYVAHKKPTTK